METTKARPARARQARKPQAEIVATKRSPRKEPSGTPYFCLSPRRGDDYISCSKKGKNVQYTCIHHYPVRDIPNNRQLDVKEKIGPVQEIGIIGLDAIADTKDTVKIETPGLNTRCYVDGTTLECVIPGRDEDIRLLSHPCPKNE